MIEYLNRVKETYGFEWIKVELDSRSGDVTLITSRRNMEWRVTYPGREVPHGYQEAVEFLLGKVVNSGMS